MSGYAVKAIDEMATANDGLVGSADVEVGGDRVSLIPGRMLRVAPETKRKLLPGPDGVRILAIGSTPAEAPYRRPEGLDLPADS